MGHLCRSRPPGRGRPLSLNSNADATDHRVEIARLPEQTRFRRLVQIEPNGDRQTNEEQDDKQNKNETTRLFVVIGLFFIDAPRQIFEL